MQGNVAEWCEDYFGHYSNAPKDGTAQTKRQTSEFRVLRGGSWYNHVQYCRAAYRYAVAPDQRYNTYGFRIVASQEEPADAKKSSPTPPPIIKGDEINYDLGNGIKLEMIQIHAKGKKFMMGSPLTEPDRSPGKKEFDAEEQHEIVFGHDFAMGSYEVTQEQYQAIMRTNPSKFKGAKRPVETVSWGNIQAFIKKLNEKFDDYNVTFRLPSEAEWEYACRAGTTTAYNMGRTLTKADANFDVESKAGTKTVGSYRPNAFGLHDMHGNVYEWCEDFPGPYSNAPRDGTAQLTKQSSNIWVLRGGNWSSKVNYCRSAFRYTSSSGAANDSYGFRLVSTPNKPANVKKADLPPLPDQKVD